MITEHHNKSCSLPMIWIRCKLTREFKAETRERMERAMEILIIFSLVLVLFAHESSGDPLAPAMFIFGDSLIDDGNNNFLTTGARSNYFPYGIDLGFPTGRFSNGLTVVDFGAQWLGLPLIPPVLSPLSKGSKILRGLNFASAAAGILDETGRHYGELFSFNQQLVLFEKTLAELYIIFGDENALSQYLAKSIFLINVGSNDYINNYLLPNIYITSKIYSSDAFANRLIRAFTVQLAKLYRMGARKVAVVGIGPLGCIPSQLAATNSNGGCADRVNDLVNAFNIRLVPLLTTINSSLPGSFFVYQNVYDTFSDVIANPSNYGFTVANKACCGNGRYGGDLSCLPLENPCANRDQYVFWDSFHPTQAVNKIIAEGAYSDHATDCYPISIRQLALL